MPEKATFHQPSSDNSVNGLFYLFKGLLLSFLLSILLFIPCAAMCTTVFLRPEHMQTAVYIVCALSSFFFGFYTARHTLKSGLLNGGLAGIFYFLVLFLTGLLTGGKHSLNISALIVFILSLFSGAAGGITGINTLSNRHRR